MSNKLLTAVWDRAPYYGGALLVYLALADQASDEGICWPSETTIAGKARMNVRNCRKHLRQLEADGAISIYRRGVGRKTTIYIVNPPMPSSPPPPQDDTPPLRGVAGDLSEGSQETSREVRGVAGDLSEGSQETSREVAGDLSEGSQETPRSLMDPIKIHQENRKVPPSQKMMRAEPEPERLTWGEMESWCNRNHVPKHAPDRVRAWNAAHPNRVWGTSQDRIVEGSLVDSARAASG